MYDLRLHVREITMTDQSGAIAALTHVGIDVSDLERAEAFYSALLGVERYAAWDQFIAFTPLPNGMIVYLQQVPEKKTAKTRVHFDLTAPDVIGGCAQGPGPGRQTSE